MSSPTAEQHSLEKILSKNATSESPDIDAATPAPVVATENETQYLSGLRLHMMTLGISLNLYLANLEVSIIATSVLSISNDFHGFSQSGWILTGYLITYTGFIIIWSKLSDILGRKSILITTACIFVIFSGACGAAQNISQLIIFRVLQGIGAAGTFALTIVIIYEMVPKQKYPAYMAMMAVVMALAMLSGPLFGGAISNRGVWRWVFLMNVPAGVVAIVILALAMPAGFPRHKDSGKIMGVGSSKGVSFAQTVKRLDILGSLLLLGGSLLLVAALLEGGVSWDWSSGGSIAILVISGVLWISFFFWEWLITPEKWTQEPVFPWRFLSNREWMGLLLTMLLNGMALYIFIITIPQRFQTVNGLSAFQSGVRLLPYSVVSAIGGVIANVVASRGAVYPIYILEVCSALTAIGTGLLTTTTGVHSISHATYGYMVLAGLGVGGTFGIAAVLTAHVVEKRDLATASGALVEFRILGGAVGLAIVTGVLNNYLSSHLSGIVTPEQLKVLLKSTAILDELSPSVRAQAVAVFAEGYNIQMKITTGITVAQCFTVWLLWRKKQITVV